MMKKLPCLVLAIVLVGTLTAPRAADFQPPLSSIQFPIQYISDGPDRRSPLKNVGEIGSTQCRAALCIETIGKGNDSWRLPLDMSAPVPFEGITALKISFVRHGNAYRPVAKLRAVPLRPFMDSIRAATHMAIVGGIMKDLKNQVGDDVKTGIERIRSDNYFYVSGAGFTNKFKFYVLRDGVYQKWQCESSSPLYSLCLAVEVEYTQTLVTPINESFVLQYNVFFRIFDGKFVPEVSVDVSDITPGIPPKVDKFAERLSEGVRSAVLAAASPALERMNATLEKQRGAALLLDGAATFDLDLQWRLTSYGFHPFQQVALFPVLDMGDSAAVIEPTPDLFPCQEVAPSYTRSELSPGKFNSRMYPPGKASALRLTTPLIDVHSEPFALDMEFEGAPLPPAAARALHAKLRQSSPEFNAWWVKSNALCTALIEGDLQPLPPPPTPFDASKCPKETHDAEPIPPECAGAK